MNLSRLKHFYKSIYPIFIIAGSLIFLGSCSTNSGGGVSLDGDLRYLVEGSEGESVYLSSTSYTETEGSFETIGSITIGSSGSAEGDLENGNFTGYQLQASPQGDDDPDITLKLLGDGEVLGETNETNANGILWLKLETFRIMKVLNNP